MNTKQLKSVVYKCITKIFFYMKLRLFWYEIY